MKSSKALMHKDTETAFRKHRTACADLLQSSLEINIPCLSAQGQQQGLHHLLNPWPQKYLSLH